MTKDLKNKSNKNENRDRIGWLFAIFRPVETEYVKGEKEMMI